jgi:predicted AlkP superfamily pyrophosphatase or phosphodiesterase
MTSNSLSKISEEFSREMWKLEARLKDFSKDEGEFVKELWRYIEKSKGFSGYIEKLETKHESKNVEELMKLRLEAAEALSEALKKESKTQHGKSHLLESYTALILSLEKFQNSAVQRP